MDKKINKQKEKLAKMQAWAADEMKNCAEKSCDPQLKKKYEQTAAINRIFYEQLNEEKASDTEKSEIERETEILLRAYFLQNALYREFSLFLTEQNRPQKIDEMCDRQVLICRELLDEAENRIKVINSTKEDK